MMLNIIAILFSGLMGVQPTQEVIYSKTETFSLTGTRCFVYRTSFWGDNNTPQDPKDDRFVGNKDVLDCGEDVSVEVPEDVSKLNFLPDGTCAIIPGTKLIRYDLYKATQQKKEQELTKNSSTVIPNERDVKPIRVRDMKQD